MRRHLARSLAGLGSAAALALTGAPAQGEAPGPHSEFIVHLASMTGGDSASITLSCPPEWSEHPHARAVCAQLEAAGGMIGQLGPIDGFCTKEYAPVLVMVAGHWHGVQQAFMRSYPNRCEANLATGGQLLDL